MDKEIITKEIITKEIIGLTYEETINYFKELSGEKYYFRPIQMDNIILWKDSDLDNKRCNIIFINRKVDKIDGWY